MRINHTQAARLLNMSRGTLYKHVDKGKVSQEKDHEGNPVYDLSELVRAYPEKNITAEQVNGLDSNSNEQGNTPLNNIKLHPEIEALKEELEALRSKAYEADKFRELYQLEKERRERAERQEDESREIIKALHRQLPAPDETQSQPRRKILGLF